MASTTGLDLSVSGLASGVDWLSVISQLAEAERSPEILWKKQQTTLNQKNAAFTTIKNYLTTLQTDILKLKEPSFFDSRTTTSSDADIATSSASTTASLGSYALNIIHMATAARINGTSNIGNPISADGNLEAVTLGTAGFATPITAGTFTVDGEQITISTSDTLQQVFDQIASATGNHITASYDPMTDRITLTSGDNSEIILGSATDTSNFLQVTKLFNTGAAGPVTSAAALGSVRTTAAMADSGLATAITDGGSGQGEFVINGVSIAFDTSTDSISDVLARINASAAGVMATYDAVDDRFELTNKEGGDIGIALEDVTGNFLAATGLAGGTFSHGQNLTYTVDGGPELISQSNTITQDSSGIAGLSVTVLGEGEVTVSVASDTATIKAAIQSLIDDYNKVQSYIATQSATSTDSDGKVTAGLLTGDLDASRIITSLRSAISSVVSATGLTSALDQLADLGIHGNGKDNTIKLIDANTLDEALAENLDAVKTLFTDATNGLAFQLDSYLTSTVSESGTLVNHQATLTKQSASIDTQIANLERIVEADIKQWTKAFRAMEEAQALINQQLSYLSQQIDSWSNL